MKNSSIYQFTKSLYSFKHIAAFRLTKISSVLSYLFFLAFLLCLPLFASFLFWTAAKSEISYYYIEQKMPILLTSFLSSNSSFIFIPVIFLFYYLFVSFIVFMKAAVFGSLGFLAAALFKKKADYRSLFRMAVYSMTVPALLAAAGDFLHLPSFVKYGSDFGSTMLILILSIRFLPSLSR